MEARTRNRRGDVGGYAPKGRRCVKARLPYRSYTIVDKEQTPASVACKRMLECMWYDWRQVMITREMTTQPESANLPLSIFTQAPFSGDGQSQRQACCRGPFELPGVKNPSRSSHVSGTLSQPVYRNHYSFYPQLLVLNLLQYTPQYFDSHTEHAIDGFVPLARLVLIAPSCILPSQTETSLLHLKHLPRNVE